MSDEDRDPDIELFVKVRWTQNYGCSEGFDNI